jgi:hypothetical protein
MVMAYNASGDNQYVGTDTINNMIPVNVNGNVITVLNQEYILENPVLYKLNVNLPNTIVYALQTSNGLISQALQITIAMSAQEEATAIVSLINYYYLSGQNTFNATQVTVNNGNMTAILDPTTINQSLYSGQSFTLTGNVLQGQTVLNGTTVTSNQSSVSSTSSVL